MFVEKVTVEKVDSDTGFVLKRVNTPTGEYWARRMPVTNSLYRVEKTRESFERPPLNSPIQICHIHKSPEGAWLFDDVPVGRV